MARPVGSEILVNTTTVSEQDFPTVAMLADGRFVVAWRDFSQSGGDTSNAAIRAQIFNGDSTRSGGEFQVNTTTLRDQQEPAAAGLVDGRFVVTWRDFSQTGADTSAGAIRAQIFNADGTMSGGEFVVNTTTFRDQLEPAVAGLLDGRFVVAWQDFSQTGGDTSSAAIRAQIFNGDGTMSGGELLVNTATQFDQQTPTITTLADGRFVVAWEDNSHTGADPSLSAVRAQIFNADGTTSGSEFVVNATTLARQDQPGIAALPDGRFVVAFHDESTTGGDNDGGAIRARIFNGDGTQSVAEFLVNTTTVDSQDLPTVAALPDGRFVVTWQDFSRTDGDTSGGAIRGQIFNGDGTKSGSELLVNTTTLNNQVDPTVAHLLNDRFVVAWMDASQTGGDTSGQATRAQIFTTNEAPAVQDDSLSGDEDAVILGAASATDPDTPPAQLSFRLVTQATHGAAVMNPDGSYNYTPNPDYNGADSFTFVANDGNSDSNVGTVSLTIDAVNDAPQVTAPGSYTGSANVALAINGITFSDIDAGAGTARATFRVGSGFLAAASQGGVTVAGSGTADITLTGTIVDLNAFLAANHLTYTGSQDDSVDVTIDDAGNTGFGGALTDSGHVPITIGSAVAPPPVNQAPVNHTPGPLQAVSEADLFITGLSVTDSDAGAGVLTTTLSVAHGTLTIASAGGAIVAGSGTASVTLTGSAAEIDATLAAFDNVVYRSAPYYSGADTLTLTTNDNGNTGPGGPQTDTDAVAITVLRLIHGDGDFNADHNGDYLLRHDDGTYLVEAMSSRQAHAVILGAVGNEWRFIGAGNFDGNGTSDFLSQRSTDHMLHIHAIDANRVVDHLFIGRLGSEWQVLGIGDFNGDGTSDILSWRDSDHMLLVHQINANQVTGTALLGRVGSDLSFLGTGDFDGDGSSDLLWRRDSDGMLLLHDINNNQVVGSAALGRIGSEWRYTGSGDFNGDHRDDLLWWRDDGALLILDMNNNQVTGAHIMETLAADTHFAGIADFDGDGTDDLLLRRDDGDFQLQTLHNGAVTATVNLGPVGNDWHVI